jgi:membrane complex biogenesis BtpA family protein
MNLQATFGTDAPVVGMVHLQPLPGAPGFESREHVRERAVADARTLERGGVDAVLVENYGDTPFHADEVPEHTVAEMAVATHLVDDAVDLPVGVNVLRNDAAAGLAVAGAAGDFFRVNVHTDVAVSDQGLLHGEAAETVRERDRIAPEVPIFADVHVKHAAQLAERPLATAFEDAVERGMADAVVVSGPATGEAAEEAHLAAAGELADDHDVPVFAGSGVTPGNVDTVMKHLDGAIVGTSLKHGDTPEPVAEELVEELLDAAGR